MPTIDVKKKNGNHLNIGGLIALFIIFIFISSKFFVKTVLDNISGATDGRHVTNLGIIIQGILVVILYVITNVLISHGIL